MRKQSHLQGLVFMLVLCLSIYAVPWTAGAACPDNMTGYWKMDEQAAPFISQVAGAQGGVDATCSGKCPQATAGKVNGAQLFDGSEAEVPPDGIYDWTQDDSFTIEAWIKTSGACQTAQVIIGRNDWGTSTKMQWWLGCWADNGGKAAFYLQQKGAAVASLVYGGTIDDGQWHHIAGVRNAATDEVAVYVDGVKTASEVKDFTAGFDSWSLITFGHMKDKYQGTAYHFKGTLDEVAFYNRALSDTEIAGHFTGGQNGSDYCNSAPVPPQNQSPHQATLVSPAAGETGVPVNCTFKWKKCDDPDGDPVSYDVVYSTSPDFADSVSISVASADEKFRYAGLGGAGILLSGLFMAGLKRRRVALLLIAAVIVLSVSLVSCGGGGSDSTVPGDNTPADELSTQASLQPNTVYYWKVVSKDDKGGLTESEPRDFATGGN